MSSKIKRLRIEENLGGENWQTLGKKIGRTPQLISQWNRGLNMPSLESAYALAFALGLDGVDELVILER